MNVDGECDDSTNEGPELEYRPEDGECLALVLLEWVSHHDGALGRPQQCGSEPKDSTGEDKEPVRSLGLVADGSHVLHIGRHARDELLTTRALRRRGHSQEYRRRG